MFDYLPPFIKKLLDNYSYERISEIRLRVDKPLSLEVDGRYVTVSGKYSQMISYETMQNIFLRLTKHSLYAYCETIKNGYVYGDDGERIGLSGKCVYADNDLKNVKEINGMCIRLPHEIIGFAEKFCQKSFSDGVKSVLVISPPGGGKTTFLRDACRIISDNFKENVLVVDEKNELSGNGKFGLGDRTDVLSYCKKAFGFSQGVLNMRPDVIVTDELFSENDVSGAINAVLSGVKVLASCHARNIDELIKKPILKKLIESKIFDFAVVLEYRDGYRGVKEVISL